MQPVGKRSDAGLRVCSARSVEAFGACVCSRFVTEPHRATWQELLPIVKGFLDGDVVQYLDLSMNYLPGLQTLQENTGLLNTYKSFGERLSLGLDGNPLTGNEEIDHWIQAGRRFKQEAYGYQYSV